jgi:hypothetical protein
MKKESKLEEAREVDYPSADVDCEAMIQKKVKGCCGQQQKRW